MGPRRHHTWSGLQEAPELLRTRRVPELAQRLGLDLPDPLAGDREVLPDFFQRVLATVGEAEPEPQHLLLARREGVEDLVRLLPEREADDRLHEADIACLDKVEELEPAVGVLLGDRDHEPQVRLHHLLLGLRRLDLALPDDRHHALDLVGLGVGALLGELDLLLCDPDLLRLRRLELLGGLEVEIADRAVDGARARIAERDVDEVLHLLGREAAAVGPELDHLLGAFDVVEEVAQPLDEAAAAGLPVLAVDDLVADVELAEVVEHLLLVLVRLGLQPPPRGLLALLRLLPAAGLEPELLGLGDELVAVAAEPVHRAAGRDHLAPELLLLLLGELFLVDVHNLLDGALTAPELLAQLAEAFEGEVGREDRGGDLVLPFLDPLGEGDLALTRQEGDAAHLAQIEAHRILGAADGPGRPRLERLSDTPRDLVDHGGFLVEHS